MTSKEKVLQVYPNAWSQRGIGTATRGYVWAGDGSTRKLVNMDKTRLRESELWLGAWRRIEEQAMKCNWCGNLFVTDPWGSDNGPVFCSEMCWGCREAGRQL